jgi:hypothetical protein
VTEPDRSVTSWPEWAALYPVGDTTYRAECFRHTTETQSDVVEYQTAINWANQQHGSCQPLDEVQGTTEDKETTDE